VAASLTRVIITRDYSTRGCNKPHARRRVLPLMTMSARLQRAARHRAFFHQGGRRGDGVLTLHYRRLWLLWRHLPLPLWPGAPRGALGPSRPAAPHSTSSSSSPREPPDRPSLSLQSTSCLHSGCHRDDGLDNQNLKLGEMIMVPRSS
jgi:hypothetical protein